MDPNNVAGAIILTPKAGKLDSVVEKLIAQSKLVKANEPGVLMFQISKSNPWQGEGPEQVVVTLVFKDKAAAEAHRTTDHFKKFVEEGEKDKVDLEGPAELRAMTPLGGFTPLG